eukprot:CAMPEP_0117522580 /NCGR_PEP_ID=MMETSP0784-20121206/34280_1 /TAXON_ID=39447 /ORGANISM="" /LENGTH=206 /DNA_ID=CAMNT_0005318655 /DNA_START=73 /DNA_END=693 /DNA_ORIENTATION=+
MESASRMLLRCIAVRLLLAAADDGYEAAASACHGDGDAQACTAPKRSARGVTLLQLGNGLVTSDAPVAASYPLAAPAAAALPQAGATAPASSGAAPTGSQPAVAQITPFGREDTGKALQNLAASTQDTLVDAVENAEVAEIKRAVFRALTRLRAAEIKEFDTIARLETQAIDEYNDVHHYRAENPIDYIHSNEITVKEDKYTSFHN